MEKEFILEYLKEKHLESTPDIKDLADTMGIDTVKNLFRMHETLRLYIPNLSSYKDLLEDVIHDNKNKMSIHELKRITGLSYDTIRRIIKS
jgi:hypothetical protein